MARSVVTRVTLRKTGNLTVEGLDDLYEKMERVLDRTSAEKLKADFLKGGMILRDRAKANAPVRTGLLKEAIFAAPGKKDKPDVLVGVSRSVRKTGAKAAPHGHLIEFGTADRPKRGKVTPRRFFREAIAQTKGEIAGIVLGSIQEAVSKSWKAK